MLRQAVAAGSAPARRSISGEGELVQAALLASHGDQLGGGVPLHVGGSGVFGQADRLARDPLGLLEAPGQRRPDAAPGQR